MKVEKISLEELEILDNSESVFAGGVICGWSCGGALCGNTCSGAWCFK